MTIGVNNLPSQISEQDLIDLFAEYGDVREIRILSEAEAEVDLENQADENSAIAALDGRELYGNKLSVSELEKESSRGLKEQRHGTGGQKPKGK
ncbi:hypothetical protein NUACC21_71350 [Scytonema sp. NUACC21]